MTEPRARGGTNGSTTPRTAPAVSIVIPTYNRGRIVTGTLEALREVEEPQGSYEVIVVDDGSDEAEMAPVIPLIEQFPRARLVRRPNGGPAAARNTGIREATADLIVFLDDDCRPSPNWLVQLIAPFLDGDPTLGAVGGKVAAAPPHNWAQRFCAAIEYATGTQPVFENASTQNACYRRDVLESVGTFDEGFRHPGGDDPDLSYRTRQAGFKLRPVDDAVVYHSELESYRDFLVHMYHRGVGEARVGRKFGRSPWVALRIALWPAFLARIAVAGWHRTSEKGTFGIRVTWALLEQVGYCSFLLGSAVGLARGR